jgi:hypothetical protein
MISEGWVHRLAFSIRFDNHFTGRSISEALPVRLDDSFIQPVLSPMGSHRQSDGSYRFINLETGVYQVRWLPALQSSYLSWVSWQKDPQITLPVVDPMVLIRQDLWPTASASVAPGLTAVRGRLTGAGVDDLIVRIGIPGSINVSTRFTRSDVNGDFLYLLPDALAPNATGSLLLEIEVNNGAATVNGGEFVPASSGPVFAADQFLVMPGKCSRVIFQIS